MNTHFATEFLSLPTAVLTVSDTRSLEDDRSGDYLCRELANAGHEVLEREILPDDIYRIRAVVATWIADEAIRLVLTTGGTGYRDRDVTPEAIRPLLDRRIEGFGELFRVISEREIGSSTVQARPLAGLANGTLVFALPGSTGACRTAWEGILREQLDARHRPCNFAEILGS
ncbi:MAG: molybdenum cofactor biosynthesis protein B [Xanthomonadales bacterium]|nr:molybdenum cofactor biosynthesis protein B [Xanthomonadales bacterium]